jgi:hypothetical protein
MRNVLGKSCKEYQNTDFMLSNLFSENSALYDKSKKMVEPSRSQMTTQRGRYVGHAE